MSGLRWAVGRPNVGEYGDPRLLLELACRAETSGWDGVFIWDHVAYRELTDDALDRRPDAIGKIVMAARADGVLARPLGRAIAVSLPLTVETEHFALNAHGLE